MSKLHVDRVLTHRIDFALRGSEWLISEAPIIHHYDCLVALVWPTGATADDDHQEKDD